MTDKIEMWGGVECSHVRIHGAIRDQLEETGHFHRIDDLDLIAGLGIRTLRYPVLWEKIETEPGSFDWSWPDARLRRLQDLGIKPISGLMHHGSGPSWAQVLDPAFPDMFARYAGRVAERYPWIEHYTPVNEPLTTARISGLYGLWHPHGTSEKTCLQLTFALCQATVRAMKAIRDRVPRAKLVQTEDVGRIFSTERLAYQANHENERRWLALDLLAGRVDEQHLFYGRLRRAGIAAEALRALSASPCLPDIVGIDYYLTSDRLLDEQIDRYPGEPIGGNGLDTYVDTAAVRPVGRYDTGLRQRIEETWSRYRLPIAVTEMHNGSTRDEQVRWLVEGWRAAEAAQAEGVDVRAVTAWSLFGAFDWNSMLTARGGYYESGAFDVRGAAPRPTALSHTIARLAANASADHPVLDRPGWWRDERGFKLGSSRPILLVGFDRLISAIEQCCIERRLSVGTTRPEAVQQAMATQGAWVTIQVDGQGVAHAGAKAKVVNVLCRFPQGDHLRLQYGSSYSVKNVANALLDLIIDGQRGDLVLARSEQDNQYVCNVARQGALESHAHDDETDCYVA
ncbi:MAG TPA: family 1 glycosylhydrolase [Mesorhizobium sp.]|jgi:dTDP-4-dehydrorhamnose reductase|uniref:family 1 glycosylhydrolase n=1 Tax=Mesorhizobium sp. TaxID=1871066 RepID=UPI002DDCDAD5|nr:family 1 glycosylhydrolase [Mesorhizobium sp.]HEV2503758.1 family 1 glycosylhydrolase [Mesorhizobium sp.]